MADIYQNQMEKRRTLEDAKVSVFVKRQWHKQCFDLVEDKNNPKKKILVQKKGTPSLKGYAHAHKDEATFKRWFENRKGLHDKGRSETNIKLAYETSSASKQARRKSKGSGKAAATVIA